MFGLNRGALRRFEYAAKADRQQILSFYMGKNTPERKAYITESLVVLVEEECWRETRQFIAIQR